jgi:hypothetical protein
MKMIDFPIKNRFTGEIQFTAKISADGDTPLGVKIGLAVKWAIGTGASLADAYLAGANLARANLADAYLARAYLARANLADANLARANLARANLADAYLARANLADANLAGAYLADANLADANLADANLAGAKNSDEALRPFRADMWVTLTEAKDVNEVRFLIAALKHGAVDGSTYGDGKTCACLVGTLARFHGEGGEDSGWDRNSERPAERWFVMIKPGDTPGKLGEGGKETGGGFAARKALEWALQYCDCIGLDPDFPADVTIPALHAAEAANVVG